MRCLAMHTSAVLFKHSFCRTGKRRIHTVCQEGSYTSSKPDECCVRSDNENIGCLQLTRVGSRRVVQIGACIAIILSIIGAPSYMSW